MPKTADKNAQNMYLQSRLAAGITNRLDASWMLHISDRTLARYESNETVPPPDIVLKMEEKYGDRKLTARYCAEVCPIGEKYAHDVEEKDIAVAVLRLLKEIEESRVAVTGKLVEVSCDGQISEQEKPQFITVIKKLLGLEKAIEALKLVANSVISIDVLIKEQKNKAVKAAR